PVVFLERGRLYRAEPPSVAKGAPAIAEIARLWDVPDGYYTEPLAKARTITIGSGKVHATIVSWGVMLLESAIAATRFTQADGGAVELVDLRTLMPFDEEAIIASVKRSNRAIVVTEEADLTSFGRHIHSFITEKCFFDLDHAPALIRAVAAPAAPYNGPEETAFYPNAKDIEDALTTVAVR
ncbi:MAG TPA: transketolase C-terminal domain-containing protein, partial [Ktedonobacterales bacterium]